MDICSDLLLSVTHAIGEVLKPPQDEANLDARINRHFCWLYPYRKKYKHLVAGSPSEKIKSLIKNDLKRAWRINLNTWQPDLKVWMALKKVHSSTYESFLKSSNSTLKDYSFDQFLEDLETKNCLLKRSSLHAESEHVRSLPTRISRIIKEATLQRFVTTKVSHTSLKRQDAIVIPSPLEVTLDILTMPNNPASRSIAIFALKSLLLYSFDLIPEELEAGPHDKRGKITIKNVIDAFEFNRTSLSPRDRSKGKDKLPPNLFSSLAAHRSTGLVRAILSMLGYFDIRIKPSIEYKTFVDMMEQLITDRKDSKIVKYEASKIFEYDLASDRQDLPYSSDIINLIWGVQIALRGAETLFQGGLKFSSRGGMVLAIHGSAGSGKTSLSLSICAALSLFGIETEFITTEEGANDLKTRVQNILGTLPRDLGINNTSSQEWLSVTHFDKSDFESREGEFSPIDIITEDIEVLIDPLKAAYNNALSEKQVPLPCANVVVIDGLHHAIASNLTPRERNGLIKFIEQCRKFNALVILTVGEEVGSSIDYLVDTVVKLEHSYVNDRHSKPDRRILLQKARHQVFAPGSHGFSMSGDDGVRFTPQASYLLEEFATLKPSLPDVSLSKSFLNRSFADEDLKHFPQNESPNPRQVKQLSDINLSAVPARLGVDIFQGSHIFVNGDGSAGKAAFALKIAASPWISDGKIPVSSKARDRVLVISFLYPSTYYENIVERLDLIRQFEYPEFKKPMNPTKIETIHLYPGHLEPDVLFNRILWKIEQARLEGDSFSSVVIDGIHNVFLQFPKIEARRLFFPQLFNALRSLNITLIVTHTLLSIRTGHEAARVALDDEKSDALKHALVHKMDYSVNISPSRKFETQDDDPGEGIAEKAPDFISYEPRPFVVAVNSAIGQSLPSKEPELYWSRERLVLYHESSLLQTEVDLFGNKVVT